MKIKKIPRFKLSISFFQIIKGMLFFLLKKNKQVYVNRFENKFAEYIGIKQAISVSSARDGLYLILKNLGVKKSDVILSSFTYPIVPAVIEAAGFNPVFVDVKSDTYHLDYSKLEGVITDNTKILIATHLYGFPEDMDKLTEFCNKHNLIMIEDCVQSCGAYFKDKKLGTFGKAAYFSFSLTKNITTLGGGMVVLNDKNLAARISNNTVQQENLFSDLKILFGLFKAFFINIATSDFIFTFFVFPLVYIFNFFRFDIIDFIAGEKLKNILEFKKKDIVKTLNPIRCFLGIMALKNLKKKNQKKVNNGIYLTDKLSNLRETLKLLPVDCRSVYSSFPLQIRNRADFVNILLRKGIDVSLGYIKDCSYLYKKNKNMTVASHVEQHIVHVPIYHQLSDSDLKYIYKSIKESVKEIGYD